MDNKNLISFCKANPYAMKLILKLAEEYKPEDITRVSEAVYLLKDICEIDVSYSQVVALFRQLEKLECGGFYVGRKGKSSRFQWTIDLKETGELLANSSSDTPSTSKPSAPSKDSAPARSEAILRHSFHLRQDFELILSLPADLTEKDAHRIAKFVESLPQ